MATLAVGDLGRVTVTVSAASESDECGPRRRAEVLSEPYTFVSRPPRRATATVVIVAKGGDEIRAAITDGAVTQDGTVSEFEYEARIVGGSGRFENASGAITIEIPCGYPPHPCTGDDRHLLEAVSSLIIDRGQVRSPAHD